MSDIQTPINQNFATPIRSRIYSNNVMFIFDIVGQSQPSLTNTFIETTTRMPAIFHLQGLFITKKISFCYMKFYSGFSNIQPGEQQSQWLNNANSLF
jgi:hypothetical protein